MRETQPLALRKALDQACSQIAEVKTALVTTEGDAKTTGAILKLLDSVHTSCQSVKHYSAKPSVPTREHQKLLKLLQKLSRDPMQNPAWQKQLSAIQVALFWQVMYQLHARLINAFERAMVQPKHYRVGRVEKVSYDPLDRQA